jgi:phytoene synthase
LSERLNYTYCQDQVRQFDRDRYLTALFAPTDRRQDLFALYAFNHEVAKIGALVSEELLGQIRLQWWREAIAGIYDGAPRKHLVVEALAATVKRHKLPRAPFDRLIDARAFDLAEEGPQTLQPWLDYAEATSSTLTELSLLILGVPDGPAYRAGRFVGIAWALTGLLRVAPAQAATNKIFLPAALADHMGRKRRVAAVAQEYLYAARRVRAQVPKTALPALLPAVLASRYLYRLSNSGTTPVRVIPMDQLILYGHALTGRY